MNYTLNQFGTDLLAELNRGYDVVRISRWAYTRYLERCRALDPGLGEKIMEVVAMEEGPEFEMSENELREFAINLSLESNARSPSP
jgi:hypothetical protein